MDNREQLKRANEIQAKRAASARASALQKAKVQLEQRGEDDSTKDVYYYKGSQIIRFRPTPGIPYGFDSGGYIVNKPELLASHSMSSPTGYK